MEWERPQVVECGPERRMFSGRKVAQEWKDLRGQKSVTLGRLYVADAPNRTLEVVNFSEEHSVTWTCVIILMRVKF